MVQLRVVEAALVVGGSQGEEGVLAARELINRGSSHDRRMLLL